MNEPRASNGHLILRGLPPHLAHLLREIPDLPELRSPGARRRLFPLPSAEGAETGALDPDWQAYVHPELRKLFSSALEVVAGDLARMQEMPDGGQLEIPHGHFDAWLGALNQVRLAIAAEHRLDEEDLGVNQELGADGVRAVAALKVHLYGCLQQMIIDAMES